MARKCELSVETRSAIFTLYQEKYLMGKIAKKFKVSSSTVWSILKKKEESGGMVNPSGCRIIGKQYLFLKR